ncbi:hypothetical protein ACWEBX_41325, partial [Streptomyces sp. NPDC005070]
FDGIAGPVAFDEYGDTTNKQLTVYEVHGNILRRENWIHQGQGDGAGDTAQSHTCVGDCGKRQIAGSARHDREGARLPDCRDPVLK